MSQPYRLNSFFSGIGGFELGFAESQFRTSFLCEKDDFCADLLRRNFPSVPLSADINEIDAAKLPDAEVWTGGFPCQDVSVARSPHGRDGLKGSNSGLFYKFADLIGAKLPQVVLLENVTGLLNSHDGRDFAIVLKKLNELGYAIAWRVFNARYFGIPQSRPRVYVCAWKGGPTHALDVLFETHRNIVLPRERQAFLTPSKRRKDGVVVPQIAYCLAATSGRHTGMDWSRSYVAYNRAVRRLTPLEYERLQGFPDGWTLPPRETKASADDIDTLRYHALGNAVCVPVVAWIAKRIKRQLQLSRKPVNEALPVNGSTPGWTVDRLDITDEDEPEHGEIAELVSRGAPAEWQTAGFCYNGWFSSFKRSMAPNEIVLAELGSLIEKGKPDSRYFLSPNAARGIVRRVERNRRTLFPPLMNALKTLSKS